LPVTVSEPNACEVNFSRLRPIFINQYENTFTRHLPNFTEIDGRIMDENTSVSAPSMYDDLLRTRSRMDPEKLKVPPILVSGRFGDADIERAKQQLAALRTDVCRNDLICTISLSLI